MKNRCVFHVAATFLSGKPFVYMPALLLHLRLSGLPREPRERLISPCTGKSDGYNAVLTQTEAFDQKATHTFPHKAVCLKPAWRVYAVYRLPSGENSRWSGAAGFVWNDGMDSLISSLVTVSRHKTEKKKKKLSDKDWARILYKSLTRFRFFLSSHEDAPSLLCGKHKFSRLLENNNLLSEKPSYIKETTVFIDAAMQWHDLSFHQPQKSFTEIFLVPLTHAKVNVIGVLRTLWPQWITVDAPKEYI